MKLNHIVFSLLFLFFLTIFILQTVKANDSVNCSSTSIAGENQLDNDTLTITLNITDFFKRNINAGRGLSISLKQNKNTAEAVRIESFDVTAEGLVINNKSIDQGASQNPANSASRFKRSALSIEYSGELTENEVIFTIMLQPGTVEGDTTFEIDEVTLKDVAGSRGITPYGLSSVGEFSFDPETITNTFVFAENPTIFSEVGTFTYLGPKEIIAPGKVAISFSFEDIPANFVRAKLNNSSVEILGSNTLRDSQPITDKKVSIGVAIVDIPKNETELSLSLNVLTSTNNSGNNPLMLMPLFPLAVETIDNIVDLGTVPISDASIEDSVPTIASAGSINRPGRSSTLDITGMNFFTDSEIEINVVPGKHIPTMLLVSNEKIIRALYMPEECISNGSYVNIITPGGTVAKRLKFKGTCNVPLATVECRKK